MGLKEDVQAEVDKCNLKIVKELGAGTYGIVYSLNKYPTYTIKFSPFFQIFDEYDNLVKIYAKLKQYKELQEYLIEPIAKWECSAVDKKIEKKLIYIKQEYKDELKEKFTKYIDSWKNENPGQKASLDQKIEFYSKSYNRMAYKEDKYAVVVMSNLGEKILYDLKLDKMEEKHQLELIFQLLMTVIYLNKAGILHDDLKDNNIAVKPNKDKKLITFVYKKKYSIRPFYFIYPIDYGLAEFNKNESDFDSLKYLFENFPVFRKFNEFFTDDSVKNRCIKMLDNELFKQILVSESTCTIL
jgi:serine/threonine protein kinase